MYGLNPIRKVDHKPEDGKLAVQEVFHTLQGEGPFSGTPAIFIRLAGCHLACTFCDTEFESGMANRLTVEEVIAQVNELVGRGVFAKPDLVVLTGGEPLRQQCGPLVHELLKSFNTVQIETAGNLWDPTLENAAKFPERLVIVVSPKTPQLHPMIARYARHYKYVLRSGDTLPVDGLPELGTQKQTVGEFSPVARPWGYDRLWNEGKVTVWVSPMDEHAEQRNHLNREHATRVALQYGYRLSLQVHKLVNLP